MRTITLSGENGSVPATERAEIRKRLRASGRDPNLIPELAGPVALDEPSEMGSDPPFRVDYERLLTSIRGLAKEVAALSDQIPAPDVAEGLVAAAQTPAARASQEQQLIYALVAAQVTTEQARNWLRRVLRGGV